MTTPSSTPQQNSPFQRVFTQSDEISLLKTLYKLTKKLESYSPPPPTATANLVIFNRINRILGLKFTRTQINDKIRRLRAKYQKQARSKSLVKTPHDRRIFKISCKIWDKNRTTQNTKSTNEAATTNNVIDDEANQEEEEEEEEANEDGDCKAARKEKEEVDMQDFPALVSEFSRCFPDSAVWKEGFSCLGEGKLREMNEKWMLLRIEEAKVMARRAELVQQQTKVIMEAIVSSSKGN